MLKIDELKLTHYENEPIDNILTEIHGTDFKKYRELWSKANKLEYFPMFPLYVIIETNNYCNMRCTMCPHSADSHNTTPKEDISMDIIDKIVDECRNMHVPSILVGGGSECLINPRIKEILQKIKSIGALDNFLITNGLKLTDDIIATIIDLQYERVYVSLDAATPATYKQIRGNDLNKIERNIDKLLMARNTANSKLPLIRTSFVVMPENSHETELFLEKWINKVDIVDFQKYVDVTSMEYNTELPNIPYPCPDPFRSLLIRSNGDIFPCCTFYGEYFALGNLHTTTLQEAFNCDKMNELRQNILSGNMPTPCRHCTLNRH
ncbi:MAG: radical SAM protein [Methanocorpusculum sp.]|nr:radical SAM protein [Methanocorpusculum sp.]